MKKKVFLYMLFIMAFVMITGCGNGEQSYSPKEGTAEAALVERYSERGCTVTNIEAKETEQPHFYTATVTMTTDMDEDGIKEMFMNDGIPSGMMNSWFCGKTGDIDNKSYWVEELIINDDKYTIEAFVLKNDETKYNEIYYNLMKNDKLYIENDHYKDYLAQEEAEEQQSSGDSGPSAYNICYYIYERYDYYDRQEGEYSGDQYDTEVFEDAAEHFDITVEEAHAAWNNYDLNQMARQQFYRTHPQQ